MSMFKFVEEDMGDSGNISEPFLAHRAEDRLWDELEQGPSTGGAEPEIRSVRDLVRDKPNEVVRTLEKKGVRKLGEFTVPVSKFRLLCSLNIHFYSFLKERIYLSLATYKLYSLKFTY